eukprot:m.260881 g.260881  ORF g.260881 m.260881 type:complete len:235 (+) comp40819_c0_seq1:32-736(+)
MVKYSGLGPANMGEERGDCSINQCTLIAINAFYIITGFIIAAVAGGVLGAARGHTVPVTIAILGAVVAMGVCLMLLAGLGIWAAVLKRTKWLVYYSYLMIVLFVFHFPISVATLAIDYQMESRQLGRYWCHQSSPTPSAFISSIQHHYACLGFNADNVCHAHGEAGTSTSPAPQVEPYCEPFLRVAMTQARETVGAVSLTFCLLEVVGIVAALIYRKKILRMWMKKDGMSEEML